MWSLIISGSLVFAISITNSQAQGVNAAVLNAFASQSTIGTNDADGSLSLVNEKAVRRFKQSYKEPLDEHWTVGKDSYRVSFVRGSVKHMVDYHLNGRWRNTIRIYDESHLPLDIRRAIRYEFFDSKIILVNELRYGRTLAYFVKIRQNGWTKTIRAVDDEIAVVEEFREQ